MDKTVLEITREEYAVMYSVACKYGELLSDFVDGELLLLANAELKSVLGVLHKIDEALKSSKPSSPKKKFGKAEFKAGLLAEGVQEQDVNDWCEARKVFTERAFKGFLNECKKNNFPVVDAVRIAADKGWKGFEVKWLNNVSNGREQINTTAIKPYSFDIGRASETLLSQGSGGLSTDQKG